MTATIIPLIEGPYLCKRLDPAEIAACGFAEKTFGVFKGDYLLGVLTDHPCGEWCFQPNPTCPALRHESLVVIAEFLRDAETVWCQWLSLLLEIR